MKELEGVIRLPGATLIHADAISAAQTHIADESVDLIVTDPPYGIGGDRLHRHYNRDERYVVDGYVEIPAARYGAFTRAWVQQAQRVLRPGGSLYVVSGYTNLYYVLDALRASGLREVNHLIWKYNFGVFTSRKFVSSHYHILYYEKPGGRRTFNLQARFATNEARETGGNANYGDREDVFVINREYRPGRAKNKNELPRELLVKLLQYSSNEGDLVCDFFMGGCSTAAAAIGMNRRFIGFEVSKSVFLDRATQIRTVAPGSLLATLRTPQNGDHRVERAGKPWSKSEVDALAVRYRDLARDGMAKGQIVRQLCADFQRGRWAIAKRLKTLGR